MNQQQKNNLIITKEIYRLLEIRKKELEKLIVEKEKMIQRAPEGRIHLKRNKRTKGSVQFYWRKEATQKNGEYLGIKKERIILKLLQKNYDQHILEKAKKEVTQITAFLKNCSENEFEIIYDEIPEKYRNCVSVVVESEAEFVRKWEKLGQQQLGFKENSPEHYSAKDERMRSKSEELIANELKQRNIPYRYESMLCFENGEMLCPDFRILDVKKRKEYIWEHLGTMDEPEYIKRQLDKIKIYEREGYFVGRNLILTYETMNYPLNTRTIVRTIEEYFGKVGE